MTDKLLWDYRFKCPKGYINDEIGLKFFFTGVSSENYKPFFKVGKKSEIKRSGERNLNWLENKRPSSNMKIFFLNCCLL